SNAWVTLPDAATLDLTSGYTLEAWIKPSAENGRWRAAVIKEDPAQGDLDHGLHRPTDRGPATAPLPAGAPPARPLRGTPPPAPVAGNTTPPPPPPPPGDTQAPTAPTGLVASGGTQSSMQLSWSASTDNVGVVGYGVYVDGASAPSTSATSYSVTGLACGTT